MRSSGTVAWAAPISLTCGRFCAVERQDALFRNLGPSMKTRSTCALVFTCVALLPTVGLAAAADPSPAGSGTNPVQGSAVPDRAPEGSSADADPQLPAT